MSGIETKVGRYVVRDGSAIVEDDATLDVWRAADLRAVIVVFNDAPSVGGAEMKFARKTLGLKQTEFARVLRVNEFTVSDWERGEREVPGYIQRLVYEVLCHYMRCGQSSIDEALQERPQPTSGTVFEVPQRMCG